VQLEVFHNPLVRARRFYPYVVVLQADMAATGRERVIVFLVPSKQIGAVSGRLMPLVELGRQEFVLLMPSIANVPVNGTRPTRRRSRRRPQQDRRCDRLDVPRYLKVLPRATRAGFKSSSPG